MKISGFRFIVLISLLSAGIFAGSGCVFHHHDARTGTDTLYGIGVMRVRIAAPGAQVQAAGSSIQTAGLGLLWGSDERGLIVGYDHRQRLSIFDTAQPLELNYSAADFWRGEVSVVPANPR